MLAWAEEHLALSLSACRRCRLEIKLSGMAGEFYRQRVGQHLEIGLKALEKLKSQEWERLHSRKLRSVFLRLRCGLLLFVQQRIQRPAAAASAVRV